MSCQEGGIEYGESVSLSIEREIEEELEINIVVKTSDLTPLFLMLIKREVMIFGLVLYYIK